MMQICINHNQQLALQVFGGGTLQYQFDYILQGKMGDTPEGKASASQKVKTNRRVTIY
jgi:hypothetical protein